MKRQNFFRGIVLILFLLTTQSIASAQQLMNLKGGGYIGAFNDGGWIYKYESGSPNWGQFNELNFNINHQYLDGWDWMTCTTNVIKYGGFYDLIGVYLNDMLAMFNRSYNGVTGQKLILERYKTNLAAYGQRSTYQVETYTDNGVTPIYSLHPGYGYAYSDYSDDVDNTQNPPIRVKHCRVNSEDDPNGYIAMYLYENNEQTNCARTDEAINFSDIKSDIPNFRYYIKPRMRIKQLIFPRYFGHNEECNRAVNLI